MTDPKRPKDRRRQPRLAMTVTGRYMLANRHEYQCEVVDVSSSGLILMGPEVGMVGERVIVYIDDQIGRVEGEIVRHVPGGFAMNFNQPSRTGEVLGRMVGIVQRKLAKVHAG
jgi:hypothetical protein